MFVNMCCNWAFISDVFYTDAAVSDDWILNTGFWDDGGSWIDADVWID